MKNGKYFFKDKWLGVTRFSLRSVERHLTKVGSIRYIRGYIDGLRPWNRVAVVGDDGRMILGGFCWGYGGEGPCGLRKFLLACGIPERVASFIAHEIGTKQDRKGEEWRLTFKDGKYAGFIHDGLVFSAKN